MSASAAPVPALNTVEPPLVDLQIASLFERYQPWYEQRLPLVMDRARKMLGQLSRHIGDAEWLDGAFGAGDLMLAGMLCRSKGSGILDAWPTLAPYVPRAEARPAFKRAFADQLAVYKGRPQAGG